MGDGVKSDRELAESFVRTYLAGVAAEGAAERREALVRVGLVVLWLDLVLIAARMFIEDVTQGAWWAAFGSWTGVLGLGLVAIYRRQLALLLAVTAPRRRRDNAGGGNLVAANPARGSFAPVSAAEPPAEVDPGRVDLVISLLRDARADRAEPVGDFPPRREASCAERASDFLDGAAERRLVSEHVVPDARKEVTRQLEHAGFLVRGVGEELDAAGRRVDADLLERVAAYQAPAHTKAVHGSAELPVRPDVFRRFRSLDPNNLPPRLHERLFGVQDRAGLDEQERGPARQHDQARDVLLAPLRADARPVEDLNMHHSHARTDGGHAA